MRMGSISSYIGPILHSLVLCLDDILFLWGSCFPLQFLHKNQNRRESGLGHSGDALGLSDRGRLDGGRA